MGTDEMARDPFSGHDDEHEAVRDGADGADESPDGGFSLGAIFEQALPQVPERRPRRPRPELVSPPPGVEGAGLAPPRPAAPAPPRDEFPMLAQDVIRVQLVRLDTLAREHRGTGLGEVLGDISGAIRDATVSLMVKSTQG